METSAWVELFGSAVIEGFILGALLALVWSMATKVLQWFLIGQFVLLKWLESRDIVTVDWERLTLGLIENSTHPRGAYDSGINARTWGLWPEYSSWFCPGKENQSLMISTPSEKGQENKALLISSRVMVQN